MSCVGERGWEGSVVRYGYVSGADAAEKALAGIPECERGVDTSTDDVDPSLDLACGVLVSEGTRRRWSSRLSTRRMPPDSFGG